MVWFPPRPRSSGFRLFVMPLLSRVDIRDAEMQTNFRDIFEPYEVEMKAQFLPISLGPDLSENRTSSSQYPPHDKRVNQDLEGLEDLWKNHPVLIVFNLWRFPQLHD